MGVDFVTTKSSNLFKPKTEGIKGHAEVLIHLSKVILKYSPPNTFYGTKKLEILKRVSLL